MNARMSKRTVYRRDWIELGRQMEAWAKAAGYPSHAAFAKRAKVVKSMVTHVFVGRVPLPRERIALWARLLRLTGEDLKTYLRAAWFSHAPTQALRILEDAELSLKISRRMGRNLVATTDGRGRYRPKR